MTLPVVHADVCGACARAECVFAPLTGIEVLETRVDGAVLVIEARLSVNLNALVRFSYLCTVHYGGAVASTTHMSASVVALPLYKQP